MLREYQSRDRKEFSVLGSRVQAESGEGGLPCKIYAQNIYAYFENFRLRHKTHFNMFRSPVCIIGNTFEVF